MHGNCYSMISKIYILFFDYPASPLELLKQIQRILGVVEPLWEKLGDTYMLLGAEAYALARVFYNTVKSAAQAGVPGADSIAKDLGERFKKQFSNPDQETPE